MVFIYNEIGTLNICDSSNKLRFNKENLAILRVKLCPFDYYYYYSKSI